MPDRPDAAGRVWATSLGIDRVAVAVDLEGLTLGGAHDIPDGDGDGVPGQEVPALCAPDALHQSGPPEAQQDLLHIVGREPLTVGQLTGGYGAVAGAPALGKMDGDDEAVLGPGGHPHRAEYLLLFRRRPAGDLLGGQIAEGPNPGIPEGAGEHVAEVLGPGEQGAVAHRVIRVG